MEKLEGQLGVILRQGDVVALYRPQSMELFRLETESAEPLDRIAQAIGLFDVGAETESEDAAIDEGIRSRPALLPFLLEPEQLTRPLRPSLGRLTINISNACNLWCSYCYADHGHYHAPKSFMPVERAETIVERIVEQYSNVESVQFFGGEPLLNLHAIEASCMAFVRAAEKGLILRLPKFVATTNGTVSTPQALALLKKWRIDLTISWDGPKDVHDTERPFVGRGSSFDKLQTSLERYRRNNIAFGIECTYGRHQYERGISVVDLLNYFHEQTDQRVFHIAPTFLPSTHKNSERKIFRGEAAKTNSERRLDEERIVELFREAASYSVPNLLSGVGPVLEFAERIVHQIVKRQQSKSFCPAFFTQMSIAADGSVFPCFMFMGDQDFNMGNILTDRFPSAKSRSLLARYFNEFGTTIAGTRAWYSKLSGGCVAGNYISSGELSARASGPFFEAMIEECLIALATQQDVSSKSTTTEGSLA